MVLDLRTLPDVVFADADTARVEASILTVAEGLLERTLYPGDPVRLFLKTLAYVISQQRAIIDFTGKQNLLRYATGPYLDQLGALLGVERLGMAASLTTLRFSIAEPLGYAAIIPAGTRATADGALAFATDRQAVIPAGETEAEVTATAETPGKDGNGLLPGQITMLVDALPFVVQVTNVTASNSGSDVEENDHYRARIQLAPESFSVAGPEGAYRYWAMSAHPDIVDASPLGPPDVAPGEVDVRILLAGGELPSDELQSQVLETLNRAKVRPLTDHVSVNAPETVPYSLDVSWWIRSSDAALAASIQEGVSAAVNGWLEWQGDTIGRDINPSELVRRMVNAGAKRVEVRAPEFTVLSKAQVAVLQDEPTATYAGVEDQ